MSVKQHVWHDCWFYLDPLLIELKGQLSIEYAYYIKLLRPIRHKRSFQRRASQPISWLGTEETKSLTTMQTFTTRQITLRPRCALPSTPSRRQAMRPIVNVTEEDGATDKGNMHKKFGNDRICGSGDILADTQTHRDRHAHHNTSPPLLRVK